MSQNTPAPKPPSSGAVVSWPLDPAWVAIAGAALVLALAVFWLTNRPPETPMLAELNRIAALEQRVQELAARPAPDVAGLERRITEATGRVAALEGRPAAAPPDLAPLRQALAAREQAEQGLGQRLAALEGRVQQLPAEAARAAAAQFAPQIAALEARLQTMATQFARAERAVVVEALRLGLAGGLPFGSLLDRLGASPPAALARYREAPPPTLATLRTGFEEAARRARGPGSDELLPRVSSAVTIRRGGEIIWGDAAEASIQRARQALTAGHLEEALAEVKRLPAAAREAMRPWTEQAEALLAAQSALQTLGPG